MALKGAGPTPLELAPGRSIMAGLSEAGVVLSRRLMLPMAGLLHAQQVYGSHSFRWLCSCW